MERSSERRIVFSSEFFADAEPDAIRRIVDDVGPDRIHVAASLRPLARIVASQWQQYVQSGMRISFDEWLDAMLRKPPGKLTPTFWRRHRHDRLVERWAEVVGPERMTVVVIDERDHDQVLRVFEGLVGLRTGTLVADRDLANRSMTLAEIEAVRAFNIAFKGDGLGNALHHRVIHTGAATFMKRREPGPDEPRIETPQWALDRAGEIAREMVDAIAASGVHVIGDLESLAVVPRSGLAGDHQPEVCVPPEIAASMAMGVLVVSGLARGSGSPDGPAGTPFGRRRWVEPPELARLPTYHLAGALGGRTVDAVTRRISRVRRRIGRLRSR